MIYKNLFGEEIELKPAPKIGNGYAAAPGTGPEGETCGTCKHHHVKEMANRYHKCMLMQRIWTGGAGTDIKVHSPACSEWGTIGSRND